MHARIAGLGQWFPEGVRRNADWPEAFRAASQKRQGDRTLVDVPTPVDPVTHVSIPKAFNARNAKSRRDLAATVRVKVPHEPPPSRKARADTGGEDERISELRRQMRAHPCQQ